MYTLERYMKEIKDLTNSLVIKINEIPMVLNKAVELHPKCTVDDIPSHTNKKEWKYYLNLAGKMHKFDRPIKIRLIENEEEAILTADLLRNYPLTHQELMKHDKFYNDLFISYPEDIRYIHGCMYPVDIETAINAPEGTILAYNKTLVEYNEISLISELQTHINSMLSRWHVKPYTIVDELYLPSLIAFLYSTIYIKIFNIRLDKTHTNEVHSFHLEHFFRSRMDIWDNINILNKQSIFWLYKNMDVMMHNVGKQKTFEKVYNKLFAMNGIGVGEYQLVRADPKFGEDKLDLKASSYVRDEPVLKTKRLNPYYALNEHKETSIPVMIENEIELIPNTNKYLPSVFKKYLKDINVLKTNLKTLQTEKTKIIDIDNPSYIKRTNIDIFSLVMDYWVYSLDTKKLENEKVDYTGNIAIKDPKVAKLEKIDFVDLNNKVYRVTPYEGLLMFMKLLLYADGKLDLPISNIRYNKILDSNKYRYQDIMDRILTKDDLSFILLRAFKDILPREPNKFYTVGGLKRYLTEVINYSMLLWVYTANIQSFMVTANIKKHFMLLTKEGEFDLTLGTGPTTINKLLKKHGIDYIIEDNIDVTKTLKHMLKTFTGIELDQDDILAENLVKYKTILRKLTSYSLQTISADNVVKQLNVYYNNPTVLKTRNGLVYTPGLDIAGLEENFKRMKFHSYDLSEIISSNQLELKPCLALSKLKPVSGAMLIYNSPYELDHTAKYTADFITKCTYDFGRYKWYNDWLKVKEMEFEALEKSIAKTDLESINTEAIISTNMINYRGYLLNKKDFSGHLVVKPGDWLNTFGTYDFATLPAPWFKPDLDNFLKTMGINFVPLEDTNVKIKNRDLDNVRADVNILPWSDGVILERALPTGDMVVGDHVDETNNVASFNSKYQILDLDNFDLNKKYIKVAMLAFDPLESGSETIDTKPIKVLMDKHVFIKSKPTINITEAPEGSAVINNGDVIYPNKNTTLEFVSENSEVHLDPSKVEDLYEPMNLGKDNVIGLSSLPFKLNLNTLEESNYGYLSYIGLEDENGVVDVYNVSIIPKIPKPFVSSIPNIRLGKNMLYGEAHIVPKTEQLRVKELDIIYNNVNKSLYQAVMSETELVKVSEENNNNPIIDNKPLGDYKKDILEHKFVMLVDKDKSIANNTTIEDKYQLSIENSSFTIYKNTNATDMTTNWIVIDNNMFKVIRYKSYSLDYILTQGDKEKLNPFNRKFNFDRAYIRFNRPTMYLCPTYDTIKDFVKDDTGYKNMYSLFIYTGVDQPVYELTISKYLKIPLEYSKLGEYDYYNDLDDSDMCIVLGFRSDPFKNSPSYNCITYSSIIELGKITDLAKTRMVASRDIITNLKREHKDSSFPFDKLNFID